MFKFTFLVHLTIMKKNLIRCLPVLGIMVLSLPGLSQALSHIPTGSRAAALGNVSVASQDFYAVFNNQAGIANYKKPAIGVDWQNHFLVGELSYNSAGLILPTHMGAFGGNIQYYGYALYNESKMGLSFARKFGEKFAAGLQMDYFMRHIAEGYGNANAFTFEMGMQADLSENLVLGVHVFNPIEVKYSGADEEKIPAVVTLGVFYSITDQLIITAETEKNMLFKPVFRGGLEYTLPHPVSFRVGFSSIPARVGSEGFSVANQFSFGFGYQWGNLQVDIAASMHQTLGWSPGLSLYYEFGKKLKVDD